MRHIVGVAIAVTMALFTPAAARAQFMLGARIGYAAAMGDAWENPWSSKMSYRVKSQIPIQLDAAVKATKELAVGAYFSYGSGQEGTPLKNDCARSGQSCSTSDMRLGVQALYSFTQVNSQFVPWAGLGIGYEWMRVKYTGDGVTVTFKGWELLNLQLGGDYVVTPQLFVGPYVMFSIAQFSAEARTSGSLTTSGPIPKATHEWLGVGVRGKFDL